MNKTDRITPELFEALGACRTGVKDFRQHFPNGLRLTQRNVVRCANLGLDIDFAARFLLSDAAYEMFDEDTFSYIASANSGDLCDLGLYKGVEFNVVCARLLVKAWEKYALSKKLKAAYKETK